MPAANGGPPLPPLSPLLPIGIRAGAAAGAHDPDEPFGRSDAGMVWTACGS